MADIYLDKTPVAGTLMAVGASVDAGTTRFTVMLDTTGAHIGIVRLKLSRDEAAQIVAGLQKALNNPNFPQ